jgi:hypothetical protein
MHRIELPPLADIHPVHGVRGWLRAAVVIQSVEHYLDLVPVRENGRGVQRTGNKDLDSMLALHHLACGADGPFATIVIEGRTYVLFLTPSCS